MAFRLGNGKLRKDQTDHYGRIKRWEDKGDIIEDSDDIVKEVSEETGKTKLYIFADLKAKIERALLAPLTPVVRKVLMGLDETNSQAQYYFGRGFEIMGETSPYTINTISLNMTSSEKTMVTNNDLAHSDVTSSMRVAVNEDGSTAKIYGSFRAKIRWRDNPAVSFVEIRDTGLRPASNFSISGAVTYLVYTIDENNKYVIDAIGNTSMSILTSGQLKVNAPLRNPDDEKYFLFMFSPVLLQIKDFGDPVPPEP